MGGILDKLKQKGPAGLPMGAWAGVAAVGLYLAYRWFANRSGDTSAGSAPTTAAGGSEVTPTAVSITVKNPKAPKHKKPPKHKKKVHHHGQGTSGTHHRVISKGHHSKPHHPRKRRIPRNLPGGGGGRSPVAAAPRQPAIVPKESYGPKIIPTEQKVENGSEYHATTPPQKSTRKTVAGGFRR